ncbi:phosphoribosyltransferase [Roseiconus lacunae]|uniref:hypothetical protein n=1 Tax=Roseiconus lacunae TaxID=2605694 RepID=UPI0030927404|nr:phosphoribosyltransferase [Stieleria sp. HD01]
MSSLSEGIELQYFSFWAFQPRASRQAWSDKAGKAYDLMTAIKNNRSFGGKLAIPRSVEIAFENETCRNFFCDGDSVAVPVPGSAPRRKGSLWVPLEISKALRKHGLVADVSECLVRHKPVTKSATAGRGGRPDPIDHYESIKLDSIVGAGYSNVVLVDDVLTRGSTVAGCAAVLMDADPEVTVRCFSLERTMGMNNFQMIKHPEVGEISAGEGWVRRDP